MQVNWYTCAVTSTSCVTLPAPIRLLAAPGSGITPRNRNKGKLQAINEIVNEKEGAYTELSVV